MSGENASSADNQQETLMYLCGFMVGESSISLIRATNFKGGTGFYYTPDITISNADFNLLADVNHRAGADLGIMTPIKGGYNLSFRGQRKVGAVLNFFESYPPIRGDMIQEKLALLRGALSILAEKQGRNKRLANEEARLEEVRQRLRVLKKRGSASMCFLRRYAAEKQIGYFLAGITDAEGSMGFRRCGKRLQPYFCVGMREEAIVKLFQEYFGFGSIYYRPASKLYQYETGKRENVLLLSDFFLCSCPVRLRKNQDRLRKIKRILNDYTPSS